MTIEDVLNSEQVKNGLPFRDYLSSICKKEIEICHLGWEMDTVAWIMDDGTVFTTNHDLNLEIMDKTYIKEYIDSVEKSISALRKVIF